jgi:hypothetical protein
MAFYANRVSPMSIHLGQLEAFPLGRLMVGYVIRQETLPERPGSTAVRRYPTLPRQLRGFSFRPITTPGVHGRNGSACPKPLVPVRTQRRRGPTLDRRIQMPGGWPLR